MALKDAHDGKTVNLEGWYNSASGFGFGDGRTNSERVYNGSHSSGYAASSLVCINGWFLPSMYEWAAYLSFLGEETLLSVGAESLGFVNSSCWTSTAYTSNSDTMFYVDFADGKFQNDSYSRDSICCMRLATTF